MLKTLLKAPVKLYDHIVNRAILKLNRVSYGKHLRINGRLYVHNRGTITLGHHVTLNSGARFNPIGGQQQTRLIAYEGGCIDIGDHVGVSNSTLVSRSAIRVGDHTMIGGSCNVLDTDFHSTDAEARRKPGDVGKSAPIEIGSDVFVGAHCIILKGVTLPDRAIVPAGAVIRRSPQAPARHDRAIG